MGEEFKDSLKKDLKDVVVDAQDYRDRTDKRFKKLDKIDAKLNDLLKDILIKYFMPENADKVKFLDGVGDTIEKRLEFISDNSWKLKGSKAKELKDEIYKFGKDKQAKEQDIRSEMEKLLQEEANAIKDNEEILEKYKDQLLKDEETVKELNADIAGCKEKIKAIDNEITSINSEISTVNGEIENLDRQLENLRKSYQEKDKLVIQIDGEIEELERDKAQETLKESNLKKDKENTEKELKDLKKQRDKQKEGKNDPELNKRISDLESEVQNLDADLKQCGANIVSYKQQISDKSSAQTDAKKMRSQHSDEIKTKDNLRTRYVEDRNRAEEKKTTKEGEKTEILGDQALKEKKVKEYNLKERKDKYNNILKKHKNFSKALENNNARITKKFRDLKINEPNKPVSTTNNPEEVKADENSAKSQGTGSGTPAQGGSSSNLPSTLTNEELTQNFINDVTKINDPEVLRKQLKGYGFQTYVNALPYIKDSKKRKQIVRMLKERQWELDDFEEGTTDGAGKYTPSHDEELMEKLVGKDSRKLFEIVNKIGKNGSLKKLNKDELRTLRKAIDNYNENILNFTDDDIKALDDKFMKHVSHSALISEYDTNAWQRFWNKHGLFSRGNDRIKRADLREEILGGMKSYNTKLSERKEKSQKKGNEFQELLGRYNEVTPIEPTSKDSPSITDSRSDLQRQGDEELQSRN